MIIIVYGYEGSGVGHWQRWLADELTRAGEKVAFPDLPQPEAPQKAVWVEALARIVDAAVEPVTFVCHSLGCWALDHLIAERGTAGIERALLAAPPSPFLIFEPVESFLPPPQQRAAWAAIADRSLLVGSDDDDFTSREEFEEIAERIGLRFHFAPGAGHINIASGYGPWPFALDWVRGA